MTETEGFAYAPEVADVKVVALYDPSTGRIVHLHTVTMFKGGRVVSEREAVDAAHHYARHSGYDVSRLKAKISSNRELAKRPHRIDVHSGEFVRLQPEDFGQREG